MTSTPLRLAWRRLSAGHYEAESPVGGRYRIDRLSARNSPNGRRPKDRRWRITVPEGRAIGRRAWPTLLEAQLAAEGHARSGRLPTSPH